MQRPAWCNVSLSIYMIFILSYSILHVSAQNHSGRSAPSMGSRDLPPSPPPSDRRCPRRRRRRLSSPPSLLLTALVPSRLVALSRLLPPAFPLRCRRQCLRRQPFQRQPYRCRQSSTSFIVGSRLLAAGRLLAASAASSSSISASSLAAAAAHPARCGCVFARPSRTLYSADHCALALPPPVT